MTFEDLSPEQKAQARACKTPDELLALAKEEGIELTDAQLEDIAGGWTSHKNCDRYNDTIHT